MWVQFPLWSRPGVPPKKLSILWIQFLSSNNRTTLESSQIEVSWNRATPSYHLLLGFSLKYWNMTMEGHKSSKLITLNRHQSSWIPSLNLYIYIWIPSLTPISTAILWIFPNRLSLSKPVSSGTCATVCQNKGLNLGQEVAPPTCQKKCV